MKSTQRLYFVAILPPKPIYTKIRELQYEIKKKFGSKAALKPPVHITLQAPFKRPEEIEKKLTEGLEKFCNHSPSFNIEINGFGSFDRHTIYVKPEKTPGLMAHQKHLINFLENEFDLSNDEVAFKDFNPHFTIGYRDIKGKYNNMWPAFKDREFKESFHVKEIHLLKHNYKFWEIVKGMQLAD